MTSHDNLKTTSHDNLKTLSLFSGISGLSIGQPVMYCEIDKRATDVLKARMKDGSLPKVPIHTDVTTLLSIPTGVDLLEAGFPCQDISCAGVQRGFHGKKSILFYHVARLVETSRPPLVFLENVDYIKHMPSVWKPVLTIMSSLGYDCKWGVVGACHVGGPHRRHRWFCLCKKTRPQEQNHPVIDFGVSDKMHTYGHCSNYIYQKSESFVGKAFAFTKPIVLKPIPGGVCSGTVVTKPMLKQRWATPRCRGGTISSRNLTKRCSTDLAAQLRFATSTPDNIKKLSQTNADWVDWLMGFPIGWSSCSSIVSLPFESTWSCEPSIPRLCKTNPANTVRLHLLGNACTRQQCTFAFETLKKQFESPESNKPTIKLSNKRKGVVTGLLLNPEKKLSKKLSKWALKIQRFDATILQGNGKFVHVGYVKKQFLTQKAAVEYYNAHNPHMRALNAHGTWKSDWDPNTQLRYIVERL